MNIYYNVWFENKESNHAEKGGEESIDLPAMPALESDEKVKVGKTLKFLTPNKLLSRLLVLLAQIKAGNNSDKLKSEIRKILYLLYQHNKITEKLGRKYGCNKRTHNFLFC